LKDHSTLLTTSNVPDLFFQVKSKLKGHQKRVTGLAFSTNLNILVSSGADAQVNRGNAVRLFLIYHSEAVDHAREFTFWVLNFLAARTLVSMEMLI
jgi:WD40 repeat protein